MGSSSTRHLLPIQSSSRSHESITNNQSFIMKATIIATALAFSSVAVAAPGGDHGKNGSYKKGDVKADYGNEWPKKEYFTSTYSVVATPDQVINTDQMPAPGEPGAVGYYNYGINSKDDVICYDIVLKGVTGDYQSAAKTATHIHEAPKGRAGPPRLAFPNPQPLGDYRRSKGCLKGPFTTGINVTGSNPPVDTGAGFKVAQIEANPAGFSTDAHTTLYVPGVVRGQLG